jgi:chromosome partitioning protein
MKIISFLNSKGGVGKTTLATNLARYLYIHQTNQLRLESYMDVYREEAKILLVDADPQGSIRDWQEAGNQSYIDIIAADRKKTLEGLVNVLDGNQYDFVIIDTPGKISEIMAAAISISDLCLIPVQPSPYDIWATEDITEMVTIRHQLTGGRPDTFYVLNRCIPNTKISKEVIEYFGINGTAPFQVMGSPIHQRVCFAETANKGETVFDIPHTIEAPAALREVMMLGQHILEHFRGK